MIQRRRASARYCHELHGQRVWFSFYSQNPTSPRAGEFGDEEFLSETRLRPGDRLAQHPGDRAEAITYVCEGALTRRDPQGQVSVIHAGEFLRGTVGHEVRQSETNASRSEAAHIFQVSLRASKLEAGQGPEKERFTAAQRRNSMCVVASQDGRAGSLRIHQDALIISCLLEDGHHFAHELSQGRSAWLHVVRGNGTLGDLELATGDGAGITAERAVSFTAHEETEILLIDRADSGSGLQPH